MCVYPAELRVTSPASARGAAQCALPPPPYIDIHKYIDTHIYIYIYIHTLSFLLLLLLLLLYFFLLLPPAEPEAGPRHGCTKGNIIIIIIIAIITIRVIIINIID